MASTQAGTMKELEHITSSLSNAKPYIMTEIVVTRQDQRHENIFLSHSW